MTGQVELSVNNGVAQIVLARPEKHNAITREMALELARICREIDENNDIRVATITGAGDRAFSAGSDLNALADISDIWAFRNRVEYAADAVHRERERGMRLDRDRTVRHGAGGKTLDNLLRRLDFLERDRLPFPELEFEQAAESHVPFRLVVDDLRVFPVGFETRLPGRMLQLGDRVRRPHVLFAADAERVFAARVERMGKHRVGAERLLVQA